MLKLPMTDLLFYKCFDKELHVLICFKGLNFTRRPKINPKQGEGVSLDQKPRIKNSSTATTCFWVGLYPTTAAQPSHIRHGH
ncbi:unnamed protein product, partial [Mesorhabditis belari]|uniref:Uncharacterized protein n=1 Tax=Mesorhabditis belari TaxID=2138241 RepID=A0AAF3FB90_9BILA